MYPSTLAAALTRCAAFRPIITEVIRHEGKGSKTRKQATGMYDVLMPAMGALSYTEDDEAEAVMKQAAEAVQALESRILEHRDEQLKIGIRSQLERASSVSDYESIAEAAIGLRGRGNYLPAIPRKSDYGLMMIECSVSVRLSGSQAKAEAAATVAAWEKDIQPHRWVCEKLLREQLLKALE